ncbi:tetratricopeptide repeat protein [Neorhodopirellula lusitana]|uniref:tetratricopeptide repeat protein n=1 Tax=Neorhodopirellula lusitana TaxID=445327 RepID=UPI00384C443B
MFRVHFLSVLLVVLIVDANGFPAVGNSESPAASPGSISDATPPGTQAPLLVGITVYQRKTTTDSAEAQRYFEQGLNLAYAFNHDEAIRSFQEATRHDPQCAMAWWGISLCNGPHINNPPMDKPHSIAAWQAFEKARSLRDLTTPVERALIDALGQRYRSNVEENIAERETLNQRYADAMQRVHQQYPDDHDVAVLYAESLMNLRPWDLWSDEGEPRPETPRVLTLLENVMQAKPGHPGANHLYVHAVEASPQPERAVAAADRLRTLMPGSGHMIHMPAHIDVRTGKWAQAAEQNEMSMKVDRVYCEASPQQDFYSIYMLHNPHFLSFVCMMQGRQNRAIEAAQQTLASIPDDFLNQSPELADPFMAIEYQVLVRFAQWDQVLASPAPREDLPITTAMWRFARATALAAKQDLDAADREQTLFRETVAAVDEDAIGSINLARDILKVGEHTLAGEIAFQKGEIDTAVSELRKGIAAETDLLYMEPPEWIQPVRHSLGAVLVAAQRWDEAEQVYRDDLDQWPENGWALYGLAQCLRAKGDAAAANEVEERFRVAWKNADTRIGATCLCVPGAKRSRQGVEH